MRSLFILLVTCVAFSCRAQFSNETVFRNVNVIPMDEEKVIKDQDVVIQNGIIKTIGAAGKVKFDKNARIIEAKGKFLIPGLAEMHAHVPPVDELAPMKDVLSLFLNNGVTTIRGMLGHPVISNCEACWKAVRSSGRIFIHRVPLLMAIV